MVGNTNENVVQGAHAGIPEERWYEYEHALRTTDFGDAPLETPECYPGQWPQGSVLLVEDWLWPIRETRNRRLEQARVRRTGCDAETAARFPRGDFPLSYALLRLNATQMDKRRPFLAVGSNANPAQLRRKLHSASASLVVPMTVASVQGLAVAFSRHVTHRNGRALYVPTTINLDQDATGQLIVLWLDEEQALALNETEPNYFSRVVSRTRSGVRVQLRSEELLSEVIVYESRWGVIRNSEGQLVRMKAEHQDRLNQQAELMARPRSEVRHGERYVILLDSSQPDEIRSLDGSDSRLAIEVGEGAQQVAEPAELPDEWLKCSRYAEQGGIACFHEIEEAGVAADGVRPQYLIRPTTKSVHRFGDSVIRLHPSDFKALGSPRRVSVVSALSPELSGVDRAAAVPGVVVKALPYEPGSSSSDEDPGRSPDLEACRCAEGHAELDQIPRNALGLEIGERVVLQAVDGPAWSAGDLVAANPVYTFCRVQASPLVTMERDIAVMDPLAMDVIGVEAGDEIVIEGSPKPKSTEVPSARLRVVLATPDLQDQRAKLVGGGLESRYPSALDALGVWPDLSWIFLDLATRQKLNLGLSRVAAVRVRASRRDLLVKEARELLLVLVVAAIGALTIISDGRGQVAAIVAVIVAVSVVVIARLRRRIAKSD